MKWIAAKVNFDHPDHRLATDLVADAFYALGLKGVQVEDPEIDLDQDWGEDAVPAPSTPAVIGYFPDTPELADRCRSLERALQRLEKNATVTTHLSYTRIDEQDWAEAWKEYFWPEKITDTIVVKPSWREYEADPDEIILTIDPGMAFGTGTHPTTSLCIRMMQYYLRSGDAFLDIGTGSGILMVAAAKLGAGVLVGVDNDPLAVTVARKNLMANDIDGFHLSVGNLVESVNRTFTVIAANILAEVILRLLPHVPPILNRDGIFISSGIITAKKEAVLSDLHKNGFSVDRVMEKEGWVAIAARRNVSSPE